MTRTAATVATAARKSPFQGLTQFGSDDEHYFFGREAEREILAANLIVSRLTIVYGPSGVGKSSLLSAGVQHDLLAEARAAVAAGKHADHLIVLHAGPWQGDAVRAIDDAIRKAARDVHGVDAPARGSLRLDELVERWTDDLQARLLIILDQFEEYLLYAETTAGLRLDRELPRAVTRTDIDADFMISIREDALAGLDRFKSRIPSLFDTRVRIERLDRRAATRAIREPIERWNEEFRRGLPPIGIEDELIADVLDQVRAGQVVVGQQGRGAGEQADRIETPHLQLVMERLWDAENFDVERPMLHRTTLESLGGAREIVVTRGRDAIDKLAADEQRVVATIFDRLVTPSGAKIAHSLDDLAKWAKVEPAELRPILDKLCAGDLRILRPIAALPGSSGGPRYELFHDVLAKAILDWQARYEHEQALAQAAVERERAEEEARRERENAVRARRRSIVAIAAAVLAIALLVAGVFLWRESKRQEATARSLALASGADKQLGVHPEVSLLLGLEAYRSRHRTEALNSIVGALESSELSGATRFLHGHDGAVDALAVSPDRRTLVSAGADSSIRLWDIATGKPSSEPLFGHEGRVTDVAFSPDGSKIASAGEDGATWIWNAETHVRPCKLGADTGPVHGIAFSPDGRTLASADTDGLRLWDLRLCASLTERDAGRLVTSVAFAPDGRTVAAGGDDGTIKLWDVQDPRRQARPLAGHTSLVRKVLFSPDGRRLVSVSDDGTIRLWDVQSGKPLGSPINTKTGPVYAVAWDTDGRLLASGGSDNTIRVWNAADRKLRVVRSGQPAAVFALTFGAHHTLFSAGQDGTIRVWDLRRRRSVPEVLRGHRGLVYRVAYSPDGETLASAGDDGTVRLWNVRTGREQGRPLDPNAGALYRVAYSPDGSTIASAGEDGAVRLWDVRTHAQIGKPLRGDGQPVEAVAFAPGREQLASAGSDGTIRFWDVHTHAQIGRPLRVSSAAVHDVAFSPDGHRLATAHDDWVVRLWDADDRKLLAQARSDGAVNRLAFSADGRELATAANDKAVRLWDARTLAPRSRPLIGHDNAVLGVAFRPDSRMVASAGGDGTVRLWDVRSGSELGAPLAADDARTVTSVTFSPDGRTFASSGADGKIRVWNGMLWRGYDELRDHVCELVGTGLSHAEWDKLVRGLPYHQSCP